MRSPAPRLLLYFSTSPSVLRPASPLSTNTIAASSYSSPSSAWKQRHDDDSKAVKVTVWWDIENCAIPTGISPYRVAHRITTALRSKGIKGPVTITAFGNVLQLSHATQDALCTTGISLNHVPNCGKNSTDRSILADLVYWVAQNPPPAHFFLISGDKDFASILHRLRMSNYNILIAGTDRASNALFSAATIMWHWNELVRGEELIGKHFNHPPDGMYGSWYGHCKNALHDPFLDIEESILPYSEDSVKEVVESKPRQVPKALVNKIGQILASKPNGVTICELYNELRRSGSYFDKDYFGHKKLSSLVSSLSDIATVKPHPTGESDLVAYSARGKSRESVLAGSRFPDESVDCGDKDQSVSGEGSAKADAKVPTSQKGNNAKTSKRKISADTSLVNNDMVQDAPMGGALMSTPHKYNNLGDTNSSKVYDSKASIRNIKSGTNLTSNDSLRDTSGGDAVMPTLPESGSSDGTDKKGSFVESENNKEGIFRRIWRSLGSLFQRKGKKDKYENSDNLPVSVSKKSKESEKALPKSENVFTVESRHEHLNLSSMSEISGNQSKNGQKEHFEEAINSNLSTETHHLFSEGHFWDSLETFLRSPKGSELVSKAMTRKHLIMKLQADGPLVFSSLTDDHISQLIDLLISKKWVEDCSSKRFPFRVALPGNSIPSHACGSDGLSRIFSSRGSQSIFHVTQELEDSGQNFSCNNFDSTLPRNLVELKAWFRKAFKGNGNVEVDDFKKQFELEYGRILDTNLYGYSTMESLLAACSFHNSCNLEEKTSNQRSRNETLSDCQKLIKEALEGSPAGVLLSTIKPMFRDRYGYDLDYRRLGYPKLAEMLNTLPGVKVKFDLILPERNYSSSGSGKFETRELFDSVAGKGKAADTEESVWAELGPITETATKKNSKSKKEEQVLFEKVILSDEESSDLETGPPNDSSEFKAEKKVGKNDEKSSLLQILESWENSKARSSKNQLPAENGLVDCSTSERTIHASSMHSDSMTGLKWKSSKKYNFVTDSKGSNGAEASGRYARDSSFV